MATSPYKNQTLHFSRAPFFVLNVNLIQFYRLYKCHIMHRMLKALVKLDLPYFFMQNIHRATSILLYY